LIAETAAFMPGNASTSAASVPAPVAEIVPKTIGAPLAWPLLLADCEELLELLHAASEAITLTVAAKTRYARRRLAGFFLGTLTPSSGRPERRKMSEIQAPGVRARQPGGDVPGWALVKLPFTNTLRYFVTNINRSFTLTTS
jgi:hypothetical protein